MVRAVIQRYPPVESIRGDRLGPSNHALGRHAREEHRSTADGSHERAEPRPRRAFAEDAHVEALAPRNAMGVAEREPDYESAPISADAHGRHERLGLGLVVARPVHRQAVKQHARAGSINEHAIV
jgi:hypothetical protein